MQWLNGEEESMQYLTIYRRLRRPHSRAHTVLEWNYIILSFDC